MSQWRNHPILKDRFHPDHLDDLQVLVHDGGPRINDRSPEVVWVTVTGCENDIFTGKILNQPQQLKSVKEGSEIKFMATSAEQLLMVIN